MVKKALETSIKNLNMSNYKTIVTKRLATDPVELFTYSNPFDRSYSQNYTFSIPVSKCRFSYANFQISSRLFYNHFIIIKIFFKSPIQGTKFVTDWKK